MDTDEHLSRSRFTGRRRGSHRGRWSSRPSDQSCGRRNAVSIATASGEGLKEQQRQKLNVTGETRPGSRTAWSSAVWKTADERETERNSVGMASNLDRVENAIGLGRATGFARTPDLNLARSDEMMSGMLSQLLERLDRLENGGYALVSLQQDSYNSPLAFGDAMKAWEALLADFRRLTMAVTASTEGLSGKFRISVYEGAADASLLAGNLSFYLSCQTRLLSDLYDLYPAFASRKGEFMGYALLYFGIFCTDHCEVGRIMRAMAKGDLSAPGVKFSFQAVRAFQNRNGTRFLSLTRCSSTRQRTLLRSAVEPMRKAALAALIRAYMDLDADMALSRVGLSTHAEFLSLLKTERPDLMAENSGNRSEYRFRLSKNR